MFVVHQVIALWVVVVSAPTLTASALNFLRMFGRPQHPTTAYSWLLSGNPYFPAQIALGLLLGWLLGRSLADKSMTWVWVFPAVLLGYALIAVPTVIPRFVLPAFQAGVGQSRWVHYFGWGCQVGNYCLDQTSFTRPFYASLAYSVAALAALKSHAPSRGGAIAQCWILIILGTLFVCAEAYDVLQSVRIGRWDWRYLWIGGGIPTLMGVYLILLGFSARGNLQRSMRDKSDPFK
jgi:hypothetical protein